MLLGSALTLGDVVRVDGARCRSVAIHHVVAVAEAVSDDRRWHLKYERAKSAIARAAEVDPVSLSLFIIVA